MNRLRSVTDSTTAPSGSRPPAPASSPTSVADPASAADPVAPPPDGPPEPGGGAARDAARDHDAVPEVDLPAPPYAVPVEGPAPSEAPTPAGAPASAGASDSAPASTSRRRTSSPSPPPPPPPDEDPLPRGYAEVPTAPTRPSLSELLAERLQLSAPDGRARIGKAALGGLLLLCLAAVAVTAWFTLGGRPVGDPAPELQSDTASAAAQRDPGGAGDPGGAQDAPAHTAPAEGSGGDAATAPRTGDAPGGTAGAAPPQGQVTVHVGGEVKEPGVVTLPAGSRVADAIEAAGGVVDGEDTGTLNLARPLADGEQILVGEEYEQPPPAGAAPAPGTGPAPPIDLNTATQEQLQELPGVGPVLAERIIAYRTKKGGFTSVEQLQDVSGIGQKRYAELKDQVQVSGA